MRFLLDTNICIYVIKQKPTSVLQHFQTYSPSDIRISTITIAELRYGAVKSQRTQQNIVALEQFLLPFEVIAFEQSMTQIYGEIRTNLERQGRPIGAMDLLLAAQAIALDVTLVTSNVGEFSRIPHLKWENWAV